MTSLIFVHFLLLGLRVIGTTTDTWRRCTGIVPFYTILTSAFLSITSAHFNTSDVQVMIIQWDGLRVHLKTWETPPAKILLDNSNCLCLLTVQWVCLCAVLLEYELKLISTHKYRHMLLLGFHNIHQNIRTSMAHVYPMPHQFQSNYLLLFTFFFK